MKNNRNILKEYTLITIAILFLTIGVYFFKFTNNFSFGGVSGISIILAKLLNGKAGDYNFVINTSLLVVGFFFLGKEFGVKTVYASLLYSFGVSFLERVCPLSSPLTNQKLVELMFAVSLPAVSSAILFNINASSGGTDIIAMILKKFTSIQIGKALFISDVLMVISSFFVFDVETGLFAVLGLIGKTLVVDSVIESINNCKSFTIVSENPEPIEEYIINTLHRSSTTYKAEGSYSHHPKTVIMTVMKRSQAIQLRNYIKSIEPTAFITIYNSSEIIGKGFRGFN